ncbi:hypothetical protein M1R55_30525 (plasmid) [Deinococcus sp. QL22]|nr:hypothetical protein [Deinococcus sp. QL22]UQN10709.1 hypothetical protein M1R55_30525 [Deinococcus sp. QL22]
MPFQPKVTLIFEDQGWILQGRTVWFAEVDQEIGAAQKTAVLNADRPRIPHIEKVNVLSEFAVLKNNFRRRSVMSPSAKIYLTRKDAVDEPGAAQEVRAKEAGLVKPTILEGYGPAKSSDGGVKPLKMTVGQADRWQNVIITDDQYHRSNHV